MRVSERMKNAALELALIAEIGPREVNQLELAKIAARILSVADQVEIGERSPDSPSDYLLERTGMNKKGFCITGGKGFHITFQNDWTVSVQFGPGNYCDNYHERISEDGRRQAGEYGSNTAECAVWGGNGDMVSHFDGSMVSNRWTPAEVLELLNWAAAQPRVAAKDQIVTEPSAAEAAAMGVQL